MLFIVVSYDSKKEGKAKVFINGIYNTKKDALLRQCNLCGNIFQKNGIHTMTGRNGIISWIKIVEEGDMHNMDIYSPDTKDYSITT